MNDLKVFENPAFGQVRTLAVDGEPWLVGKDVATVLGYKNPQEAIRTHVDDDDKGVSEILTPGGKQNITIINESGLYSLILSSKLPNAREFKHWVTSEVLPSIRKTGQYINPRASVNPELAEKRANAMALNAKTRVAKMMMRLWDKAGVRAQDQALALNAFYEELSLPRSAFGGLTDTLLDKTAIAKHLGVRSKSGAPHAQAIGAVIGYLKLEDGECQKTPYSRNGHDGESEQYTPSVEQKVAGWLAENGWPTKIVSGSKSYSVQYRKE